MVRLPSLTFTFAVPSLFRPKIYSGQNLEALLFSVRGAHEIAVAISHWQLDLDSTVASNVECLVEGQCVLFTANMRRALDVAVHYIKINMKARVTSFSQFFFIDFASKIDLPTFKNNEKTTGFILSARFRPLLR